VLGGTNERVGVLVVSFLPSKAQDGGTGKGGVEEDPHGAAVPGSTGAPTPEAPPSFVGSEYAPSSWAFFCSFSGLHQLVVSWSGRSAPSSWTFFCSFSGRSSAPFVEVCV